MFMGSLEHWLDGGDMHTVESRLSVHATQMS